MRTKKHNTTMRNDRTKYTERDIDWRTYSYTKQCLIAARRTDVLDVRTCRRTHAQVDGQAENNAAAACRMGDECTKIMNSYKYSFFVDIFEDRRATDRPPETRRPTDSRSAVSVGPCVSGFSCVNGTGWLIGVCRTFSRWIAQKNTTTNSQR